MPSALIHTFANRQVIVAACENARAGGIRPGLSLAQARALCPNLLWAEHDPAADARSLEALARWFMAKFSPTVQIADHDPDAWGLFFDLTGCERLFGPLDQLVAQLEQRLSRLAIPARLAIAPTPGAAWALTFENRSKKREAGSEKKLSTFNLNLNFQLLTSPSALSSTLAPLPPISLRLDPDTLDKLHHLGIETVAQILKLPRASLTSRFGPLLLRRIDEALGNIAEPLAPLPHHAPVEAGIEFDGVVDALEALWQVIRELLEQIVAQLTRRGAGARRLSITFLRPDSPAIEKTIELSRASRELKNLFNLVRCAMETIGQATPAKSPTRPARFRLRGDAARTIDRTGFIPQGFVGIQIRVPVWERLSEEQIGLLEQEEHDAAKELDALIERLRIRLGDAALASVEEVESHVPEKAWKPAGEGKRKKVKGKRKDEGGRKKNEEHVILRGVLRPEGSGIGLKNALHRDAPQTSLQDPSSLPLLRMTIPPQSAIGIRQSAIPSVPSCLRASVPSPSALLLRPLHLLPSPVELRVMVRPSHDRDGAPVAFVLNDRVHRIVHTVGPERIAGAWWAGHDKTRDYFDVEDETGRRWWLMRIHPSGRWFLHGVFS